MPPLTRFRKESDALAVRSPRSPLWSNRSRGLLRVTRCVSSVTSLGAERVDTPVMARGRPPRAARPTTPRSQEKEGRPAQCAAPAAPPPRLTGTGRPRKREPGRFRTRRNRNPAYDEGAAPDRRRPSHAGLLEAGQTSPFCRERHPHLFGSPNRTSENRLPTKSVVKTDIGERKDSAGVSAARLPPLVASGCARCARCGELIEPGGFPPKHCSLIACTAAAASVLRAAPGATRTSAPATGAGVGVRSRTTTAGHWSGRSGSRCPRTRRWSMSPAWGGRGGSSPLSSASISARRSGSRR